MRQRGRSIRPLAPEDRQHRPDQRARTAHRLPAGAGAEHPALSAARITGGAAGRVHVQALLGDPVRPRAALSRRLVPQHPGGDGLPRWIEADRSLEDEDVVVWYTMNFHHLLRPEDWPVQPVVYASLHWMPEGSSTRTRLWICPCTRSRARRSAADQDRPRSRISGSAFSFRKARPRVWPDQPVVVAIQLDQRCGHAAHGPVHGCRCGPIGRRAVTIQSS